LPVTYRNLFESFSGIMERHGGRPHWAKQHSQGPKDLAQLYPKFNDFVSLIKENDPQAVLRSEYTRRHIFGEVGEDVDARTFKKSWKKEGEVKI
jgi:L-gulonolactone oxidase